MLLSHPHPDGRTTRRRRTLAAGFEHAVRSADRPAGPLTAEVPVDRADVRANADRLLALAAILRSGRPLPDEGVRAARALLTDGCGPLYLEGGLSEALTRVELALDVR